MASSRRPRRTSRPTSTCAWAGSVVAVKRRRRTVGWTGASLARRVGEGGVDLVAEEGGEINAVVLVDVARTAAHPRSGGDWKAVRFPYSVRSAASTSVVGSSKQGTRPEFVARARCETSMY